MCGGTLDEPVDAVEVAFLVAGSMMELHGGDVQRVHEGRPASSETRATLAVAGGGAAEPPAAGEHEHGREQRGADEHDRRAGLDVEVVAEVHPDEAADRADAGRRGTACG